MNVILLGSAIGLGVSVILVFNIWYFSVRHWDESELRIRTMLLPIKSPNI